MNLIDLIQPIFELTFTFILGSLIFLGFRAIQSHWSDIPDVEIVTHSFEKGKTEYTEPPRPHSKTFGDFLQLALMSTPNRQKKLTQVFSLLIQEYIEIGEHNGKYSENLTLLINNPNQWLQDQHDHIKRTNLSRKRYTSDILYERFIEILIEVQDLLGIPLLSEIE